MKNAPLLLAVVLTLLGGARGPRHALAESKTEEAKKQKTDKAKKALNKVFKGRVIKIKKKTVTLYYDFEDENQLKDFEDVRPPRLLDLGEPTFKIQGGRLVLSGSTHIRHLMEGEGKLTAHMYMRVGVQKNLGTIFTEPVISDFYTVLNLFDHKFNGGGGLLVCSCGLHEDEGADTDMSLVNFRDLIKGQVKKIAKVGQDVEVEVSKEGFKEFARVGKFSGKGNSKGKGKNMKSYQFGLWVDHSRMSIDDLTITVTLTDEFLDLNDLKAEIDIVWEEVPTDGPLKGISGVPPRLRSQMEAYAARETRDAAPLVDAMGRTGFSKKLRQIATKLIQQRGDPKVVPLVIDGIYSQDKMTRKLSISVIKSLTGKTWGLSASAGEKKRRAAMQKLNQHLNENRRKYFE